MPPVRLSADRKQRPTASGRPEGFEKSIRAPYTQQQRNGKTDPLDRVRCHSIMLHRRGDEQ